MNDIETKFKFRPDEPIDEAILSAAQLRLQNNHQLSTNPDQVVGDILLFDRMGRATVSAALDTWKKLAKDLKLASYIEPTLQQAIQADNNERVMEFLRASLLAGLAYEQPRGVARFFQFLYQPIINPLVESLFEYHRQEWERKQAAAAAGAGARPGATGTVGSTGTGGRARTGATSGGRTGTPPPPGAGAPPSPGTRPATGPATGPAVRTAWDPEDLTNKSQEWVYAWRDAEKRWNTSPNLPPANTRPNSPAATASRFEFGMSLLHEDLFGPGFNTNDVPRVRALFDFMLVRIWPDPALVEKFLKDRQMNRIPSGLQAPRDFSDLSRIAQALFIPESLKGRASLLSAQKRQLRPLYRRMMLILHTDQIDADAEVSQNLKDYVNTINQVINSSWADGAEKLI